MNLAQKSDQRKKQLNHKSFDMMKIWKTMKEKGKNRVTIIAKKLLGNMAITRNFKIGVSMHLKRRMSNLKLGENPQVHFIAISNRLGAIILEKILFQIFEDMGLMIRQELLCFEIGLLRDFFTNDFIAYVYLYSWD